MGVFDQAARLAVQISPEPVLTRLLPVGEALHFREWLDTRTLPTPGGIDRTADMVAALDDPSRPELSWLVVLEFESRAEADKIDVTLEEVAALRNRARHREHEGKYRVTAGIVYLTGQGPELLDMTFSDGRGTRHAPLVWHLESDDAARTLEAVATGSISWGMLSWVPLMASSCPGKK